jgi:hypothetical protein
MIRKARMQDAAIARKPSTTITAMAQCGNPEPEEGDCTSPPWEDEEDAVLRVALADAADAEATEAEDADAAEEEEAAITESGNVVSTMCSRSTHKGNGRDIDTHGRQKT